MKLKKKLVFREWWHVFSFIKASTDLGGAIMHAPFLDIDQILNSMNPFRNLDKNIGLPPGTLRPLSDSLVRHYDISFVIT